MAFGKPDVADPSRVSFRHVYRSGSAPWRRSGCLSTVKGAEPNGTLPSNQDLRRCRDPPPCVGRDVDRAQRTIARLRHSIAYVQEGDPRQCVRPHKIKGRRARETIACSTAFLDRRNRETGADLAVDQNATQCASRIMPRARRPEAIEVPRADIRRGNDDETDQEGPALVQARPRHTDVRCCPDARAGGYEGPRLTNLSPAISSPLTDDATF